VKIKISGRPSDRLSQRTSVYDDQADAK